MGKLRKDYPNWHKMIDDAVKMHCNWIHLHMPPDHATFEKVKAGTFPDYWKDGVAYARSKGLKVGLENVNKWYPEWKTDLTAFMADLTWAFDNWQPDGYEAEEFPQAPTSNGTIIVSTTLLNSIWNQIRALINTKKATGVLPPDFQFGASIASFVYADMYKSGIDIPYLNTSKVLDYIRPEMVYTDNPLLPGSGFETVYNQFKTKFNGLDVRPVVYYTWSGLQTDCMTAGFTGYNSPTCFNQGNFNQLRWAWKKNIGFSVYIINNTSPSMYPGSAVQYPGATYAEKVGVALSGPQDVNITALDIQSTPTGASIKINGGSYGTTPRLKELPAGAYTVELTYNSQTWTSAVINLQAGQTTVVDHVFATTGTFDLKSTPPGASVYMDNVLRGVTDLIMTDITPSVVHTVKLTKPGFDEITDTLVVSSGATLSKTYTLTATPTTGTVDIKSTPTGASLKLRTMPGGTWGDYGTTDKVGELAAGNYEVTMEYGQFPIVSIPFTISIGQTTPVNHEFVVVPPKKWKCSGAPGYTCIEADDGTYDTQAACQEACKAPPPPPKNDGELAVFIGIVYGMSKIL